MIFLELLYGLIGKYQCFRGICCLRHCHRLWMQQVASNFWYWSTTSCGVICQETTILIFTTQILLEMEQKLIFGIFLSWNKCLTRICSDSVNLFAWNISGTPGCTETCFRVNLIGLFVHDDISCWLEMNTNAFTLSFLEICRTVSWHSTFCSKFLKLFSIAMHGYRFWHKHGCRLLLNWFCCLCG
jgi:hypothetical protein